MSHTVAYDPEHSIIRLTVQGEITTGVAKEAVADVVNLAKERNCFRILSDFREATLRISTLEIFKLPDLITDVAAASGLDANRFRRAGVVAGDFEDFSFFETVSLNKQHELKYFRDVDEALSWLTRK